MVFVEHSFIMGLDDDVLHNVEIRSNCLFQITNIASCQATKYHIDSVPVNRVTIYNDVHSCNISKIKSNISYLFCGYLKLEMGVKWCVVFNALLPERIYRIYCHFVKPKTYQALNYWLVKYLSAFILLNLVKYRILDVTFQFIS